MRAALLLLPLVLLSAGPCAVMRSGAKAADHAGSLAKATEDQIREVGTWTKAAIAIGAGALISTWGKTAYRRWRRK